MSHWNHRLFKKFYEDGSEEYSIREVFYDNDGGIYTHTIEPVSLSGEDIEGLKTYLQWCLQAFEAPILVEGEVKCSMDEEDDLELDEPIEKLDFEDEEL